MSIRKDYSWFGGQWFWSGYYFIDTNCQRTYHDYAWGVELYGEWVTLSALPAYLVLCNIGLTSTAGNSLAMVAEKDDQQQMLGNLSKHLGDG